MEETGTRHEPLNLTIMAKQTEIYLNGKIDNLVFYSAWGQKLVRSMPARLKQTTNTRARSRNFGFAATAGKILRSHLEPVLPFPKDKKMQSLFSGAISRWLGLSDLANLASQTPEGLTGFSFNPQIAFTDRCKIPFIITRKADELQIALPNFIPAQVFAAPAGTQQVELSFCLAGCSLQEVTNGHAHTKKILLPFDQQLQPAQNLALPVAMQQGNLLVLGAAVRFINEQGQADTRPGFLPAGIIWAAYY